MRILVVLLSVFILAGCSAAGLKRAEENTRLAGVTSPLGAIIHLPIWVAATVANASSSSTGDGQAAVEESELPVNEKKQFP